MLGSLELSDLRKRQSGILRSPCNTRPAIWVVEENGTRAVVKDFSQSKFLYRNIIGRFLIWRESKAYKRLRGFGGVPGFYRVIDGIALVTEEIPGRGLRKHDGEIELSEAFFDALKSRVDGFHRMGLAHCDLKSACNVLLGHDGLPYIIDWAASISEREFGFFPLDLIYRRFVSDDHEAIAKLKLRYLPNLLTSEEKRRYEHRSPAERGVRAVRNFLRQTLKRIA